MRFDPSGDSDPTGGGDADEPPVCSGTAPAILVGNAGSLAPLVEDPEGCRLFGADRGGGQVYLIDTTSDVVLTSVAVGGQPVDLVLSADRTQLYVAVLDAQSIVVLDAATGATVKTLPTAVPPFRLAPGPDARVFYVEEAAFSAIREVNLTTEADTALTGIVFHEPDLDASPNGTTLYLAESNQPGSRLFRFDTGGPFEEIEHFTFDGGFTLPSPARQMALAWSAKRAYFADRVFEADDLSRMRGWVGDQVLAASPDGRIVVTAESVHDGFTYVRFAARPHPGPGVLFSADGHWLYEFDGDTSLLSRTAIATLVGTHQLGETLVPSGSLAQHRFTAMLADPTRPYLYALDVQQNQLVWIDRQTLLPVRAEIIGSAPTDMALRADGEEMVVATFGATEIAIVDLTSTNKALKDVLYVPSNPYRIAISFNDRIVYAEQDQYSDMNLLDRFDDQLLATTGLNAIFQPDIEFDPTGQFLYAGESSTEEARLKKYDLSTDDFIEVEASAATYSYPTRRLLYFGGHVYYAGHKFDAGDLTDLGSYDEDIVLVTADGKFAVSRRHVFLADTFAVVDGLPVDSGVMAASPDSTQLYQFDNETGALFVQALPND